jgi:hypothetical protein
MKKQSIEWLRNSIPEYRVSKVTVVGGAVGALLIANGRSDLLYKAGGLTGDGLKADDDRFIFCSYCFQRRLLYPLCALQPVYSLYTCKYEDVDAVYEEVDGQAVVLLKDPLKDVELSTDRNGHG